MLKKIVVGGIAAVIADFVYEKALAKTIDEAIASKVGETTEAGLNLHSVARPFIVGGLAVLATKLVKDVVPGA